MNLSTHHNRHGISLLEVLISMGILTVGLVSVLSMIPAGRSQTMKANAYDRGTTLAANAAADLINRGLIRPAGWLSGPTEDKNADGILDGEDANRNGILDPGEDANGNNNLDLGEDTIVNNRKIEATPFAVFDPLYSGSTPIWPRIRLRTDASYAAKSLFSFDSVTLFPTDGIPVEIVDIIARSEDDILFSTDVNDGVGIDDPPKPKWSNGSAGPLPTVPARHVFEGVYSQLATLTSSDTDPAKMWRKGSYALLTIVTFFRRDATLPPMLLTDPDNDGRWLVDKTNVPEGISTVRELIKPGAVLLEKKASGNYVWKRILMAADSVNTKNPLESSDLLSTTTQSYVSIGCEGGNPVGGKLPPISGAVGSEVYIFPSSIGSLQMQVRLE